MTNGRPVPGPSAPHIALHRALVALAVSAGLAGAVLLTGCATASPDPASPPPASGGMGMGGEGGMAPGSVIVAPGAAALDATGAAESPEGLTVPRVLSPEAGWVVVRSTAASGAVLGSAAVPAGESRDVRVRLRGVDAAAVRVALHVDRGRRGNLEFDPASTLPQPDGAMWADGVAVAARVPLRTFGARVPANSALAFLRPRDVTARSLTVDYLIVPGASWVAVYLMEDGVPAERVGLAPRARGEWHRVRVPLTRDVSGRRLAVVVHADTGAPARFGFTFDRPLGSDDAPYVAAGIPVIERITVAR